ncbi:hypothetical protein DIPPA_02046 [Diplonema papillatum]|nr:hypothetical protein DIPPA_02046 [Diplonema papillatum]
MAASDSDSISTTSSQADRERDERDEELRLQQEQQTDYADVMRQRKRREQTYQRAGGDDASSPSEPPGPKKQEPPAASRSKKRGSSTKRGKKPPEDVRRDPSAALPAKKKPSATKKRSSSKPKAHALSSTLPPGAAPSKSTKAADPLSQTTVQPRIDAGPPESLPARPHTQSSPPNGAAGKGKPHPGLVPSRGWEAARSDPVRENAADERGALFVAGGVGDEGVSGVGESGATNVRRTAYDFEYDPLLDFNPAGLASFVEAQTEGDGHLPDWNVVKRTKRKGKRHHAWKSQLPATSAAAAASPAASDVMARIMFEEEKNRKFDLAQSVLEEMVESDARFYALQDRFKNAHCGVFDDADENKLEYTPLFKEWVRLMDGYTTAKLNNRIVGFDLEEFMGILEERRDEVSAGLWSFLLSFTDFEAFKQAMLDHKAGVEDDLRLDPELNGIIDEGQKIMDDCFAQAESERERTLADEAVSRAEDRMGF